MSFKAGTGHKSSAPGASLASTMLPPSSCRMLMLVASIAALLSIILQGFIVGVHNNVFHLAIIADLPNSSTFADDVYIQSLRHFTSAVWFLMPRMEDDSLIYVVLLSLHALSRVFLFFGLLLCASLLGIHALRDVLLLSAMLLATPLLLGQSVAGSGGLLINHFTHSEFGNGLALLCFYFAARGRLIPAFAVSGIIFDINAYMGAWNIVPLTLVMFFNVFWEKKKPTDVLLHGLIGLVCFLAISSPIIYWIVSNPDFGTNPGFDYRAFINFYHPIHFFIWSVPLQGVVAYFVFAAAAACAFLYLRPQSDPWLAILAGVVLVWLVGCAGPLISASSALINLHLLRSSSMLNILTALAVGVVATKWIGSASKADAYVFGPSLAAAMCLSRYSMLLGLLLLLARNVSIVNDWTEKKSSGAALRMVRPLAVVAVVALLALRVGENYRDLHREAQSLATWQALGGWINSNTPESSVFLVPLETETPVSFEVYARRRAWVDKKRGAAVMWLLSYYHVWYSRVVQVEALPDLQSKLAYAAAKELHYVVAYCSEPGSAGHTPTFRTGSLCLYKVGAAS